MSHHEDLKMAMRDKVYYFILDYPGSILKDVAYRFRVAQKVILDIVDNHELMEVLPYEKGTRQGLWVLSSREIDHEEENPLEATELTEVIKSAEDLFSNEELQDIIDGMHSMLKNEGFLD